MEKNLTSLIVVGVIGLVVGFGASNLMSNDDTTDNNATTQTKMTSAPMTDTEAANLRVLINSLQKEHVDLASAAVRSGFDGRADFAAAAKELDNNSVQLSAAVGSVYGKEAEAQFLDIWRSHIGFFVDYTVAAKAGNKAGMDTAVTNLMGYVESISQLLSSANPNLPKQVVKELVTEHVLLLKGAVDGYGAGDFTKSYAEQSKAYDQIGKIADGLSGAIVKQFPEKF